MKAAEKAARAAKKAQTDKNANFTPQAQAILAKVDEAAKKGEVSLTITGKLPLPVLTILRAEDLIVHEADNAIQGQVTLVSWAHIVIP